MRKYRIVRHIRHAPWRYGLIHLVPGVRLRYRGRWYLNGATG
jgi:hypothetical protein